MAILSIRSGLFVLVLSIVRVGICDSFESDVEDASRHRKAALSAAKMEDWERGLKEQQACVSKLKKLRTTVDESRAQFLEDAIASENNRLILICRRVVSDTAGSRGISDEARSSIEDIAPPKDPNDDELLKAGWSVYAAYAALKQYLADYYIRRNNYAEAALHAGEAETCFARYEELAPPEVKNDPEIKQWRETNRKRINDLISTRGLTEGSYVQNNGLLQKWIGRVVSINRGAISIRMTYVSSEAPPGFHKGMERSFGRREVKAMASPSILALLNGYR